MSMSAPLLILLFFFNDTATTEIYTLSLHDALPICLIADAPAQNRGRGTSGIDIRIGQAKRRTRRPSRSRESLRDRKSTRLNSSHLVISYAVFCLKKKTPDQLLSLLRTTDSTDNCDS